MVAVQPDLSHQKFVLELLIVEIRSREAPLSGISLEVLFEKLHRLEVLSKEIGILTSFGPIQHFLETFVLSKETGLSGTVVFNSIFLENCPSIH